MLLLEKIPKFLVLTPKKNFSTIVEKTLFFDWKLFERLIVSFNGLIKSILGVLEKQNEIL